MEMRNTESEMAYTVREIERLKSEKKDYNRDMNERIKDLQKILRELADSVKQ